MTGVERSGSNRSPSGETGRSANAFSIPFPYSEAVCALRVRVDGFPLRSSGNGRMTLIPLSVKGPRMSTNILDCSPDKLEIGMPLTAVFEPVDDDIALIKFRPG